MSYFYDDKDLEEDLEEDLDDELDDESEEVDNDAEDEENQEENSSKNKKRQPQDDSDDDEQLPEEEEDGSEDDDSEQDDSDDDDNNDDDNGEDDNNDNDKDKDDKEKDDKDDKDNKDDQKEDDTKKEEGQSKEGNDEKLEKGEEFPNDTEKGPDSGKQSQEGADSGGSSSGSSVGGGSSGGGSSGGGSSGGDSSGGGSSGGGSSGGESSGGGSSSGSTAGGSSSGGGMSGGSSVGGGSSAGTAGASGSSAGASGGAAAAGGEAAAAGGAAAGGAAAGGAAAGGAVAAGGAAAGASLLAPLAVILFYAIIIIVIIIIIVGIIMFFMTVPGMVTGRLKEFATTLGKQFAHFFGADTTEQIDDVEIYDVLDYLEQMGYDLKGYGFITKDVPNVHTDEKQGVTRDPETGNITNANSLIISTYLMSDNYVYTVRNFNQTGIWAALKNLGSYVPLLRTIVGFLDNILDFTDILGKGLIGIYYEDGRDYNQGGLFSWTDIKVDPARKVMTIKRGWGDNYYEYDLDGWTGRYGMPLEFLLSVHVATMKPDLAFEMVKEFDTELKIILQDIRTSVMSAYEVSEGRYVTFEQVELATQSRLTTDGWSEFLNWFDQQVLSLEEAQALFNLGLGHASGCTCNFTDGQEELGDSCKARLKEIIWELSGAHEYSQKAYNPYIEKVENHWFRDVYFKLSASEAAKTGLTVLDADYEAMTGERWTEYEKYESGERAGEYKLYIYDENQPGGIGQLYDGTQEDANDEGVKVVKKQVTATTLELEAEGILTDVSSNGSWFAYKKENVEDTEYRRLYPDSSDSIKKKIYYKTTMYEAIVQKDDAVRGVTNATIKDMFLNRYYFNYDGSVDTANVIAELREKLGMTGKNAYGEIEENRLEDEYTLSSGETVKVKDYVSKVSITQDSLAAFSMLENTHTLDADFIYKDFKELIVELGYFKKEELSDGRKPLLQWVIPEIGSAGYPKRVMDKDEQEYGTLLHSKEDYEIDENKRFEELIAMTGSEIDRESAVARGVSLPAFALLGSSGDDDVIKSPSQVSVNEFLETTREMCEKINEESYDYCVCSKAENCSTCLEACKTINGCVKQRGGCTCQKIHCRHVPHNNPCSLPNSFESAHSSVSRHNFCCATLVSWALQNVGLMPMGNAIDGADSLARYCKETLDGEVVEITDTLQPGDIIVYEAHIEICGEAENGGFVRYNGGHYATPSKPCIEHISGWPSGAIYAIRLKWGGSGEKFEGYYGNEAVVSPVTGILLDYGTYTEDDGVQYRKNVEIIDEDVTDKVGYAKILVLNEEVADQIVKCSKEQHDTSGFINVSEYALSSPDNFENLGDAEKALYGYKLFADDYENGKIAGYVLYIDGFECELPGTESNPGTSLSMDYFRAKAARGRSSLVQCQYEETLYEVEELFKLTSQTIQNRQQAKLKAKELAAPLYRFTGSLGGIEQEMLIIKEGTVIGKTIADKELVEEYRGEEYIEEDDALRQTTNSYGFEYTEDIREVRGNYLRLILRDTEDNVVENIEDYMKIDELQPTEFSEEVIKFMAGVITAEAGPNSKEGQSACAWVIKNRYESGDFGATLEELLVAERQFTVVATSPEECSGGYVRRGETVSLEVNGVTYYVNAPSDLAIEVANGVMNYNDIPNPGVEDRLYWKSADTYVDPSKRPIQIPEGTGNKFHY